MSSRQTTDSSIRCDSVYFRGIGDCVHHMLNALLPLEYETDSSGVYRMVLTTNSMKKLSSAEGGLNMVSDLYKRTLYLNKDIEYLFGHRIIEYDIRSAGFNIIRHFKFVPQKVIDALAKLDKHSRHVAIGMMERNNEDLKKKMKLGFQSCRKKFFVENNVQDEEILSIKKDAIFLIDRVLTNTKFDTIEFVNKNEYQSYLYMNKIEFYIGDEKIDCKGIRDEKVKLHEKFMLEIIREFSRLMVESFHQRSCKCLSESRTGSRILSRTE